MTYIVGLISQKGGVGKTTLSRGLAREAAAGGLAVKIADLDIQQGTAVNWQRRRLEAGIEPRISVESFKSAHQALQGSGDFDLLVLDGPARASEGTYAIARAASLVIQPTGASLDDLEPALLVFSHLLKDGIEREKLAFALTRVGTPSEEAECRNYITQAGFAVLEGCLYERPAYRQAQNAGMAVTETRYKGLNEKADTLIQSMVDRIVNNG